MKQQMKKFLISFLITFTSLLIVLIIFVFSRGNKTNFIPQEEIKFINVEENEIKP